jgi:hypothetical protein
MRVIVKKITPRRREVLDINALRDELRSAMDELQDGIQRDFESTVSSWSTSVSFATRLTVGQTITLQVTPSGSGAEIWGYVNSGTRPHVIRARGRSLAFRTGYRAKTRPGSIRSGGGGASGDYAYAPEVQHPGTEPRDFTGQIAEKWKPEFRRVGENAMRRVARR